jgi:hypothetical protein
MSKQKSENARTADNCHFSQSLFSPIMATASHRSLHPPGHPATVTVLKDTRMYELSFVGHDPAPKSNRIPMVRRLMGQVMLGSDYPLTQRHLPDERNPPFHLHETPNNARTNIRARILITLPFKTQRYIDYYF